MSAPPPAPPSSTRTPLPTRAKKLLGFNAIARATPVDLRIVGRTLLHASAVGALAGSVGVLFFLALELVQELVLTGIAGYGPLLADGEKVVESVAPHTFRPWILWLLPAVGALIGGALSVRFAPETMGGGADQTIQAFHERDGVVRRRVAWVKGLASVFTLGFGGSGGREGPTIQIGGALGSLAGRYLKVGARERRILLVAGAAAGMAAVFRTPLGAALLAVDMLYRDDFESDALVPAILASVVSYAVFVSALGETTLFAHAAHYPFVPAHLPLYGMLAIVVAIFATAFVTTLHSVHAYAAKMTIPAWAKPAVGGLSVGILATLTIVIFSQRIGAPGQGFGILGGGYGAAQIAITGADWLPIGWAAVALLFVLAVAKLGATSLTVGFGGSAGDFGPSLVIGGLVGGAFGRACELLLHDPRIDPGAFALVGMGAFYGGIARVPISSMVMVCELAGSYDLLVPLMLAEGIAFVSLRKKSLYHAQVDTRRESPAHRAEFALEVLRGVRVRDVVALDRPVITFPRTAHVGDIARQASEAPLQNAFPVVDDEGAMVGVIRADELRILAVEPDLESIALAIDIAQPAISLGLDADLHAASCEMLERGLREIPITDRRGRIVAMLDESEVMRAYLAAAAEDEGPPKPG